MDRNCFLLETCHRFCLMCSCSAVPMECPLTCCFPNLKPNMDLAAEWMWLTFSRNASSHQNSAWGDAVSAQPSRRCSLLVCKLGQHLTSSKKCSWLISGEDSQKLHGQQGCSSCRKLASVQLLHCCLGGRNQLG